MMSAVGYEELLKDALSLPVEERSRMATRLIESIDEEDEHPVSLAWREEIARRIRSIQDGSAKLVPHDEVLAGVREELARYRTGGNA